MPPVYEHVLDSVGHTPLVRIRRLSPSPRVAIYAKLESKNPGGSVKDRIALSMILAAERSGELTRDKIVLEPTSGNTGIGLALVCAVKGYRLLLALPESVSLERRKILAALGAEFTLTPGSKGTDGAIEVAYEMAREHPEKFFMPDQYNNPANPLAHYHGTAPEIWEQTGGRLTHFVATMGTSGTLMGCSQRLKELNPAVRIVGVEPILGHKIQGLKNMREAYVPGIFDKSRLDERVTAEDEESYEMARQLALKEGLFVGMSAGAAMAAAVKVARQLPEGLIVVLLPDGGDRYLSTTLFTGVSLAEKERPVRGEIFLYNTATRQVERFRPLAPGTATIYTCGPTADGRPHLSLLRRVACTDLLVRLLAYRGLEVTHVMNVTDLDDRTIARAEEAGLPLAEFTRRNEALFFEDIDRLGIWRPGACPRASEHVPDMVRLAEKLLDSGFAYERHRSIYFDITRFPEYGKENPRDFALFKRASLADWKKGRSFKTDWGFVRPGWHVECAAMAMKYLGDRIDLHTASLDLLFPHHDNEIALVESLTGKRFVGLWFHIELVYVDGRKMSAEAGNAVTLADCERMGFPPRVVRFFLVGTHYRKKVHFTEETLRQAAATLQRIDAFVRNLQAVRGGAEDPAVAEACSGTLERFDDALFEDLQVGKALAAIFGLVREVNPRLAAGTLGEPDARRILDLLAQMNRVLGFLEFDFAREDAEIDRLVGEREAARGAGDYARADRIREDLAARGILIEDTREGPRWARR